MLRSNKLSLVHSIALFVAFLSTASLGFAQSQTPAQVDPTASTTIVAQYLYISEFKTDFASGVIAGYRIASDGKLTSIGAPTIIASKATLVPSKQGAKLFGIGAHRLWSFAVNPTTGRLKFVSVIRFPSDVIGVALGINPQSTLLFAGKASTTGARITTYRISSSGTLTPIASKAVPLMGGGINGEARMLVVDPAGKFLYANTKGPNATLNITQLQINQTTGALTFIRDLSLGQPNNLTTLVRSPGGGFLYQGFETPQVAAFSVGTISGTLHQIQNVLCNCDASPDIGGDIAIDAKGKFLFQATGANGGIATYARDTTTGLLTSTMFLIPRLTLEGDTPLFTVDSTGRFVEVIEENAVISTFAVGNDGALTRVEGSSASLPANIALAPQLRVLAVRF